MEYCKKCVYPFVAVNLNIAEDGICLVAVKLLKKLKSYQQNFGQREKIDLKKSLMKH